MDRRLTVLALIFVAVGGAVVSAEESTSTQNDSPPSDSSTNSNGTPPVSDSSNGSGGNGESNGEDYEDYSGDDVGEADYDYGKDGDYNVDAPAEAPGSQAASSAFQASVFTTAGAVAFAGYFVL